VSLRATYKQARHELEKAGPSQNTTTAPRARRGRLPSQPSPDEWVKDIRKDSGDIAPR
jgi:hypothetical protein